MRQPASRLHPLLMIGVLLPLLLVGATVAHTHDGAGIGLYNQEHDLVLMGALGSVAPLPAPHPVAPPPVAQPAPPGTMQQHGPGGGTGLSAEELLRPRQPFALYQQRGSGQLLFDMGIAGDFVASVTQRNVAKANGGTFAGQENRFFPREVELELFGQIDPYARGEVRIEAGEEAPGAESSVHLAEATLTLLTLPYGTQVKMGQMRTRFGWSNQIHEHDLPWIDRPNVLRNFFGGEGVTEKGVEVTIVPDLPFYLEGLVGVFNGDNETAFGRGSLRDPLLTARLRTFFELTDTQAIQLGISGASGQTPGEFRSTFAGAGGSARIADEVLFQGTFILGAHPAHPF